MPPEDTPAEKAALLRRQREARGRWDALLAQVPRDRMAERVVWGELSVKEVVAHLAAWERRATEGLRARCRGEREEPLPEGMSWPDYERAFNLRVREAWRDRSWEEVRREAAEAYAQFLAAADAAPDEVLFGDPPAWRIVAFNGYLHYEDFAPDIRAWLDRPAAEDVDLLVGLVRIPSVSTRERAAVEYLVGAMRARGFRARIDEVGNAVGEIGEGPVHVALVGHIDTVPGEIPMRVEGGELTGRGAVDAKGPLAAFVAAATEPPPGVRVSVVGAVEEEHPTSRGAREVARWPAPDHCVIGEPSGWDGLTVGYKGRLQARLRLTRPARHGAHEGPSIAEEGLALWERVRERASSRAGSAGPFLRLDCRLDAIAAGESDGLTERAELVVGYRLPPGVSARELAEELKVLAGEVEVISVEEPVRASRATPLARAFQRAIREAGGAPTFKVKTGTSDMNVLAPAWRCPILAYGPGDSRYDHTPMERLALVDYARAIRVLRGALSSLGKRGD